LRRAARAVRYTYYTLSADAADPPPVRGGRAAADEAWGASDQYGAGPDRRRGCAGGRARVGASGRRGARRVRGGAEGPPGAAAARRRGAAAPHGQRDARDARGDGPAGAVAGGAGAAGGTATARSQ